MTISAADLAAALECLNVFDRSIVGLLKLNDMRASERSALIGRVWASQTAIKYALARANINILGDNDEQRRNSQHSREDIRNGSASRTQVPRTVPRLDDIDGDPF